MADNTGPQIGDIWTTRVFRDGLLVLRVFQLKSFLNLSIAVVDMEDPVDSHGKEKVLWYGKGDLQFFDLLTRQQEKKLEEGIKNSGEGTEKRGSQPNSTLGGDRRSGNDAGVREKRDGQDRIRR